MVFRARRLRDFLVVAGNVLVIPYPLELGIEAVRPPMPKVGYEAPYEPFPAVLGHLRPASFGHNPTLFPIVGFPVPASEGEVDNRVLACGNVHFLVVHNVFRVGF